MLSLYIEKFISFCVIMLLLWFDFHRNIPIEQECYSIRGSPSDTAAVETAGVETLHNVY